MRALNLPDFIRHLIIDMTLGVVREIDQNDETVPLAFQIWIIPVKPPSVRSVDSRRIGWLEGAF